MQEERAKRSSISELVAMASSTGTFTDEAVLVAYDSLVVSYNADANFQGFLAATCGIARHRPHLLEKLLVRPIDAAVCMGVDSPLAFWKYADFCVQRDQSSEPKWQDFGPDALLFYQQHLRGHEVTVEKLLRSRLDEVS